MLIFLITNKMYRHIPKKEDFVQKRRKEEKILEIIQKQNFNETGEGKEA